MADNPNPNTLEIVYTWPDTGREEVRYRRQLPSDEAERLRAEVNELKRKYADTAYSWREVFSAEMAVKS